MKTVPQILRALERLENMRHPKGKPNELKSDFFARMNYSSGIARCASELRAWILLSDKESEDLGQEIFEGSDESYLNSRSLSYKFASSQSRKIYVDWDLLKSIDENNKSIRHTVSAALELYLCNQFYGFELVPKASDRKAVRAARKRREETKYRGPRESTAVKIAIHLERIVDEEVEFLREEYGDSSGLSRTINFALRFYLIRCGVMERSARNGTNS